MKKGILFLLTTLILCMTGCSNDKKTLECIQNGETSIITIENGKIVKSALNDDEEKVTDEEWQTLKKYYEFNGNETTEEITNKLKEFNEKIGYTCTIK